MKNKYPFNLQEKEKVVEDIQPSSSLKGYFFAIYGLMSFFILGFLSIFFGIGFLVLVSFFNSVYSIFLGLLLYAVGVIILAAIIGFVLADSAYRKRHYWITNKRVVVKSGLIGYSLSSIPLERVSDVIISRSFLERIFGFASLH